MMRDLRCDDAMFFFLVLTFFFSSRFFFGNFLTLDCGWTLDLFFFFSLPKKKKEKEEQKSRDFFISSSTQERERELDTAKEEAPTLGRAVYVVYVVEEEGWEGRREQRSDETSRWHRAREICTTKTNDEDDDDADEFLPVRFHHLETPRGWELRRSSNGEV